MTSQVLQHKSKNKLYRGRHHTIISVHNSTKPGQKLTRFRTIRVCTVPLSAVAFSREGDAVAIASQTGTIYLFDATRDGYAYKKSGKINCGQGLTTVDWSEDGDHLQVSIT